MFDFCPIKGIHLFSTRRPWTLTEIEVKIYYIIFLIRQIGVYRSSNDTQMDIV